MKQYYESEVLFQLMEREGFNIPSSVPPYESEIKAYLINQVKQAYPKLTDYEAEWLLYNYTKHLPADFPISSVSDVTEATFENVVPFAYQSAILKGQTLVNLSPFKSLKDVTPSVLSENGVIWYGSVSKEYFNYSMFKPNTKYIVKFGLGTPSRFKGTYISGLNMPNKNGYYTEHNDVFTTPQTFPTEGNLYLKGVDGDVITKEEYSKIEVMIIEYQEGMENWDIPYFEGMQSVRMPVLTTTGKNLFDGELELGSYTSTGTPTNTTTTYRNKNKFIPLENEMFVSVASIIHEYDGDKNFIKATSHTSVDVKKQLDTKTKYINFRTMDLSETQIMISKTGGAYEPFKSNILTCNEEVTLRSLPNGVYDTLNLMTREYIKRIGEFILSGSSSEQWALSGLSSDETKAGFYILSSNIIPPLKSFSVTMSDKLSILSSSEWGDKTHEGYYVGSNALAIVVNTSRLSTSDVEGFRTYLQSNPVTIQYETTTPIIKTVELTTVNESGESIHFMPLEGTMSVQSSGESIQPTFDMSVPVEATTQNLASFIDLEMEE